jgi:DNA-binding transcriptional LysR family regulator
VHIFITRGAAASPRAAPRYRDIVPTEAGRVLLHRARDIDEQVTAAVRMARRPPLRDASWGSPQPAGT